MNVLCTYAYSSLWIDVYTVVWGTFGKSSKTQATEWNLLKEEDKWSYK
jgi:hypothetical protein